MWAHSKEIYNVETEKAEMAELQENKLKTIIATFPDYEKEGLGRTHYRART